jgi:hypothetical protein
MSETSERYVIAVKRVMRSRAPADWIDQLLKIEDLSIVGKPGTSRILVEAAPAAIKTARTLLGKYCHVEPLTVHKPS